MAYIANKVCRFFGHDFLKGEVVPEEFVLKSKVPELLKTGVLVEGDIELPEEIITIPLKTDEGEMILKFNNDELIQIFNYLGKSVEDARVAVEQITSNDVLIILDESEHRKGMKEYIKNRALQLLEKEETE